MQAIVDFLSSIGSAILAGIDFVVSFFEDLVYIIQLTGRFLRSCLLLQLAAYSGCFRSFNYIRHCCSL